MGVSRGGLASSRSIHLQVQIKRRSFGLCLQRWYASPSKCKHKYKARLWLTERGLTLPSSGPAYGGPLKSNVRRRKYSVRCSARPHLDLWQATLCEDLHVLENPMPTTLETLQAEVMRLSPKDRARLLDRLIVSLDVSIKRP